MATINNLSEEVIDIILSYEDISVEDVINFKSTCKKFWFAPKYEKDWDRKLLKRWPFAKKVYDKKSKEQEKPAKNEQENNASLGFIENVFSCKKQLKNVVCEIIDAHNSNNYSIDNFISFNRVFHLKSKYLSDIIAKPENFMTSSFFMDEIKNQLTESPRSAGYDLTKRYCIKNMFCYLRQHSVREKWEIFKEQPHRERLLERCATIFAQWLQPEKEIFYSHVKRSLNTIAQEVLNCLREKYPVHSIFSTSAETFSYWENNNIENNYWNEEEGDQIMDTLMECIFGKLHFRLNQDAKLEYMCIDNVLENKSGQKVILSIIYHSVARRLGLRCDVIKLPVSWAYNTISIIWIPNYATNSLEEFRCFNIHFAQTPDCIEDELLVCKTLYLEGQVSTISAKEMLLEMLEILVNLNNWYNKTLMIMPYETSMAHSITDEKVISLLIENSEQTLRSGEKFAVGMIVNYNQPTSESSTGVIIGWHKYKDRQNVQFSINKIADPILPLKIYGNYSVTKQQTHYLILTDKNEMCYVGEDALTSTTGWIENSEVGRYFSKFEETHYVPNQKLARIYPQDSAITLSKQ